MWSECNIQISGRKRSTATCKHSYRRHRIDRARIRTESKINRAKCFYNRFIFCIFIYILSHYDSFYIFILFSAFATAVAVCAIPFSHFFFLRLFDISPCSWWPSWTMCTQIILILLGNSPCYHHRRCMWAARWTREHCLAHGYTIILLAA